MALIKLEADSLKFPSTQNRQCWEAAQAFLKDMEENKSSFFHLLEHQNWESDFQKTQDLLSRRIPHVDTFLHLGIGGSSLGPQALIDALGSPKAPPFIFFDNIDPDWISEKLEGISPHRVLVYVVTKSGNTFETLAQLAIVYEWLEKKLGKEEARKHLVFCTDSEKGNLKKLSQVWEIPAFSIPYNLGGRYSILSPVGLFPALIAGVDCAMLLKGAQAYREYFLNKISGNEIPEVLDLAWKLFQQYLQNKRNITVLMPYSQKLKMFTLWFSQLWAESLGKNGKGFTPLAAIGATDQHSLLQLFCDGPKDKVIGFIEVLGFQKILGIHWKNPTLNFMDLLDGVTINQLMDIELNATRSVLAKLNQPHFTLSLSKLNAYSLGQFIFFFELLTALVGYLLNVNPFDQPAVEEGKKITLDNIQACKKTARS